MVDAESQLAQEWLDVYHPVLATGELSDRMQLDGTAESLRQLEDFLRADVEDPYRLLDPDREDLTIGLVGYLGRTLLQIAGGTWFWIAESAAFDRVWPRVSAAGPRQSVRGYQWNELGGAAGVPAVRSDPTIGLPGVSPLHLLVEFLVRDGDGNQPASPNQVARQWTEAVDDYRSAHPDWHPAGEPSAAGPSATDGDAALRRWLRTQELKWPQWAARHPGPWDFSFASIDALVDAVQQCAPSLGDFTDPVNAELAEAACWYLGETFRRTLIGAHWCYLDYRDDGDGILAAFYLKYRGDSASPYYLFTAVYEGLGSPAQVYDRWATR